MNCSICQCCCKDASKTIGRGVEQPHVLRPQNLVSSHRRHRDLSSPSGPLIAVTLIRASNTYITYQSEKFERDASRLMSHALFWLARVASKHFSIDWLTFTELTTCNPLHITLPTCWVHLTLVVSVLMLLFSGSFRRSINVAAIYFYRYRSTPLWHTKITRMGDK